MSSCCDPCDECCVPCIAERQRFEPTKTNVSTLQYLDKKHNFLQHAKAPPSRFRHRYNSFQLVVTEAVRKLQADTMSGFVCKRDLVCYIKRKLPRFFGDLRSQMKIELLSSVRSGFIRKDKMSRYRVLPFTAHGVNEAGITRNCTLARVDNTFQYEPKTTRNVCQLNPMPCNCRD